MSYKSTNFSKFISVLIAVLKYTFLLLGIVMAGISGYIEFEVFKGFLPKISYESLGLIIPLLLVGSLEISKIYLTFSNKMFGMSDDKNYGSSKKWFDFLRVFLIVLSFGCTILFTTHNLSSPNEKEAVMAIEAKTNSAYDRQIENVSKDFEAQIEKQIEPLDATINTQKQIMLEERKNTYANSQEFVGPRYREAERQLNIALEKRAKVIAAFNTSKTAAIIELNRQREEEIKQKSEAVFGSSDASNPMIASVLQIFNQQKEYPIGHYIVMVLIISLVISSSIEGVIWASLTMVAIQHGKSLELIKQHNEIKEQQEIINETLEDIINK
ncbi:hypothetical protein [uncultured Croceitalea sp.]|uniref:hypothetical protein n=1 Tax=uncultured Croceitalea sp. TaxID=1798908 RepID=UPI003305E0D2